MQVVAMLPALALPSGQVHGTCDGELVLPYRDAGDLGEAVAGEDGVTAFPALPGVVLQEFEGDA